MKKISFTVLAWSICFFAFGQIDPDQFALDVSKADAANTEQLKAYIWKRNSTATVEGAVKSTVINEVSFDENGEIQLTTVSAESNVKQKPGLRGRTQQNAMEDNMDYVEKALELAIAYTYMSKGQLLDFFGKSKITEVGDTYEIAGENIFVQGDTLTVVVEKATNLFVSKKFSTLLDQDPMEGEINYGKFSSGVNHVTDTKISLAAKKAVIDAKNQDYSQRIN